MQPDLRDRKAQNGAGMEIELGEILRQERDETCVVRTGRKLGKDHLVPRDEELDPENPVATQVVADLSGHFLSVFEQPVSHRRRLPGLLVVPTLLPVSDGLAEGNALARADRQKGDLVLEGGKLLD